jgi:hypothetical protein
MAVKFVDRHYPSSLSKIKDLFPLAILRQDKEEAMGTSISYLV